MSTKERILHLEALLERVTARAAEPRVVAARAATPQAAVAATQAAGSVIVSPVVTVSGSSAPIVGAPPERMAPLPAQAKAPPAVVPQPDLSVDVEVLDESALVSDRPPPMDIEESDSRERLVAAHPLPREEETEVDAPVAAAPPARDEEAGDTTLTSPPSAEEPEPPASSRRPIAMEPPLEELAFGEAAQPPPPHTPPPESGRQIAAPPVDLDFEGDFTGVRPRPDEKAAVVMKQPIAPEVTRPKPAAQTAATFEGSAPEFKPKTFGELLDATLSI